MEKKKEKKERKKEIKLALKIQYKFLWKLKIKIFHLLIIPQTLLLSYKKSRNISTEASIQQLIEATVFVLELFTKAEMQLQK